MRLVFSVAIMLFFSFFPLAIAEKVQNSKSVEASSNSRSDRLKNLKEKFPKIVFVKHFDLGGSHYAYTEAQSDAQNERNFVPGAALCLLELDADGDYVEKTLISDENGVIRDPDVSYNGKTIVFSWKKSDLLDDYHLYSYDVETGNIRQLTFGLGYADYEPCFLPDGDIVFNSTRCVQIVDCWWTEVSNLYRCDQDGNFLRRLSYDQVHTNYPTLMDDGRVIYTRWDYNDRGQIFPQGLFQMNPDGTGQTELYGNNSWFPTTLMHSRGISGTDGKIVSIFSGHHNRQYGKLGILDPTKGRQENSGTQLIAPIRETTADKIDAWGQQGDRFAYPYPINEREFLVSYNPDPNGGHTLSTPFGIYWIDENANRELLACDPMISCHQPVPLVAREASRLRESIVDPNVDYGVFTLQDVYDGPGMQGIKRGTAKTLRVVALDFRSTGIGHNGNQGPAGGALISTPVSVGNGTWDVKIPLGDTPIYEDGSASFKVPVKTPLYFQVLDANGHCIQTMRSWATLQPGEIFSCIGCHENKNVSVASQKLTQAMQQGPQSLLPFYGEHRGFSFVKEIQPILDRHCIECHQNPEKQPPFANAVSRVGSNANVAEENQEKPFSLQANLVHDPIAKRYWSVSYLNLTSAIIRGEGYYSGRQTPAIFWLNVQDVPSLLSPYKAGAARSGLMKMFDANLASDHQTHHDVRLSREELDKIACWIDLLVPFCGDYAENNAWDEQEMKKFEYYEKKKRDMHEFDVENNRRYISFKNGEKIAADDENPSQNAYRNLALNQGAPDDPQASSNSVCRNLDEFAASNCIDGKTENRGHGVEFPSWGPEKNVPDLWWKVDFGKRVKTDQIVITIRADFPHDTWWKKCTIKGSNGFHKKIELQKTAEQQIFTFPVQEIEWLKLTDFVPEENNGWSAFSEVEVYGIDAITVE